MANQSGIKTKDAVGIFIEPDHLRRAVNELQEAGFTPEHIGLLANEHSVRGSLDDLYDIAKAAPDVGATAQESSAFGGSLFVVGTSAAMGAIVASAGVLGGALLAAAGGAVALGAIGTTASKVISRTDADYLEQQLDEGRLLLFARLDGGAGETQARDILGRHSGREVTVLDVNG